MIPNIHYIIPLYYNQSPIVIIIIHPQRPQVLPVVAPPAASRPEATAAAPRAVGRAAVALGKLAQVAKMWESGGKSWPAELEYDLNCEVYKYIG